jgi:hypothetical protein
MVKLLLIALRLGIEPVTEPEPPDDAPSDDVPSDDVPSEARPPEPSASAAPAVDAPLAPTPPTIVAAPAPARPRAQRRWARSGPWVPNAWPTRQPCTLDPDRAPLCVLVRADVFTGFRAGRVGGEPMNELRLDRAEVGTGLTWKPAARLETGGIVAVEAIRSAGPQSVTGIDGDSLIVRLLEAYGHAAVHVGPIDLGARAGLVPERWIEQLEKGYDTRGFDAIGSDRTRMFDRSDIGATLTASGWDGLVDIDVSVVNGEGRAQRELNRGKNITAIATARPLRREHRKGPIVVAIHGGFRDGSLGLASIADRRGMAAATFASPWVYAGFEYVHALGYAGRGELRANTMGGWISGRILPRWLGALAKYDRTHQDLSTQSAVIHTVGAALFSDVFPHIDRNRRRVRVYGGYQYEGYGRTAAPLPGVAAASDAHRFILQLELRGLARIAAKESSP